MGDGAAAPRCGEPFQGGPGAPAGIMLNSKVEGLPFAPKTPRSIPPVQEGRKQCLPGAFARSISWLNSEHKLGLDKSAQEIYEDLERLMTSAPFEGRKSDAERIAIKAKYLKAVNPNMVTKLWKSPSMTLSPVDGVTVSKETNLFAWLHKELNEGEDVELSWVGHIVTLTGIWRCDDSSTTESSASPRDSDDTWCFKYRDDEAQDLLGDKGEKTGVMKRMPDGKIIAKRGKRADKEVMFAVSESFVPPRTGQPDRAQKQTFFGGDTRLDDQPAQDGVLVIARDQNGTVVGTGAVTGGAWVIEVDPATARTVTFDVSGYSASEAHSVVVGGVTVIDLDLVSTDDHGDDFRTATLVAPGSTTAGNIGTLGDKDFFGFEVSARREYVIEISLGTLSDPFLNIYNSVGARIVPGARGSRVSYVAISDTTLYLSVEGYGSSDTGSYNAAVSSSAIPVSITVDPPSGPLDTTAHVSMGGLTPSSAVTLTIGSDPSNSPPTPKEPSLFPIECRVRRAQPFRSRLCSMDRKRWRPNSPSAHPALQPSKTPSV